MSNRAQRRAASKAKPSYLRGSRDDILKRLCQNGISPADLKKEYETGYEAGVQDAKRFTFKTCYAAFIMAMRRKMDANADMCRDILVEADDIVCNALDSEEAIDQAFEEVGLRLDFREAFDRVQEVDG